MATLSIIALPPAEISLAIFDGEEILEDKPIWLYDLIPTVTDLAEKYDIEKTVICGAPVDFLKGIAKWIEDIVDYIEIQVGD